MGIIHRSRRTAALPAYPEFYHRPRMLEGLVGCMVMKVLDSLGIKHNPLRR